VKRLQLSPDALASQFDAWQRVRFQNSRREFDALLSENSFVEFWGRMRKKTLDESAMTIKDEEEDEDEDVGAGGGGRASLTEMAKQINVDDMHSVLQVSGDFVPSNRSY
jgi:transcription elongation regulator 1